MTPGRILTAVALLALAASSDGATWPELVSGPLQDDSFLIEEAYNQPAGVVQHILESVYDRRSGDWQLVFAQEWPLPDERHQVSFTVPYTFAGEAGDASGPGDVLLNYRYQLLEESDRRPAVAPRLSLVLPTGSARDHLGTGSAGVQLGLPASKQLDPHWAAHLNLGVTVIPHALVAAGSEPLVSGNFGGSVVWEPVDAVNFLCELVGSRDEEVQDRHAVTRTRLTVDPGIRIGWNGPGGVQWVGGVGVPLGLTDATDRVGVLLYFSIENPFTRAARASRGW